MQNKFFRPLLFIVIFLLAFQLFGKKNDQQTSNEDVILLIKTKTVIGKNFAVDIKNNSPSAITITSNCPKNPLTVEKYSNGEWVMREAEIDQKLCADDKPIQIDSKKSYTLQLRQWGWALFNEEGKYRVSLKTQLDGKEKVYSYEFNVTAPSFLRNLWTEIFYRPILNTLIFLISILPSPNLGWGIILLTLIIKLILLAPNHKALRAQKQMQKIQPQLEALKIKYKDSPQQLAQETMEIWKKYKVSPMSSCLPMLIQFPVLIALFYVVKDGLSVINPINLYGTFVNFDLHAVDPNFLGLIDLTKINLIVLPIIVGTLQFFQIRMTMAKTKTDDKPEKKDDLNPMPMMNKMMQYFMPIMIAVFTATLPAAVGFYWGTSTLFGIGQQFFVNRSKD
jgi:YidC/Oxa1 family membrane protein insertase